MPLASLLKSTYVGQGLPGARAHPVVEQEGPGHLAVVPRRGRPRPHPRHHPLHTPYDFQLLWALSYAFRDFGDIVTLRACLLGSKQRAEAHAPGPLA
jgi:hypothetical protein